MDPKESERRNSACCALPLFIARLNSHTGLEFEISALGDSETTVELSARSPTGFLIGTVNAWYDRTVWKFGGTSSLFPGAWSDLCRL